MSLHITSRYLQTPGGFYRKHIDNNVTNTETTEPNAADEENIYDLELEDYILSHVFKIKR